MNLEMKKNAFQWQNMVEILSKFGPDGPVHKSVLVRVMASYRTGGKPLPDPMLTLFSDTYTCHHAAINVLMLFL